MDSMRRQVAVREEDPIAEPELVSRADRFDTTVDVVRPDTATDSMDTVEMLSLIWERRAFLSKVAVRALIVSTLIAFLLPTKYDSTIRLMPPDSLGDSGMILAALAAGSGSGKGSSGLASLAGSALGMKNNGALFVDLLHSRTVQTHIVDKFHLRGKFWDRYEDDARNTLDDHTQISEDKKRRHSVTVRASSPQKARDMAKSYVEELRLLLSAPSRLVVSAFYRTAPTSVKSVTHRTLNDNSVSSPAKTQPGHREQTKAWLVGGDARGPDRNCSVELESLRQIWPPQQGAGCGPCRHAWMNSSGRLRRWGGRMIRFSQARYKPISNSLQFENCRSWAFNGLICTDDLRSRRRYSNC